MISAQAFGFELSEWVVIVGAAWFVLDTAGIGRGSRLVRRENREYKERNEMLEARDIERSKALGDAVAEIDRLKLRVAELERNDQAAVLHSIAAMEAQNGIRHSEEIDVLERIAARMPGAPPTS